MDIQILANEARESISQFCMQECNAYCCTKGFLILSEEEMKLMIGNKKVEKDLFKKTKDDKYSLNLSLGCPSLENHKCLIHKEEKRSSTCKNFPIFINEKTIKISDRCPAKRNNLFYPYVHQFLKLGYKVI